MIVRIVILLFIGGLIGPIGDYMHVVSGTTYYPPRAFLFDVSLFGLPLWVPAIFGFATVLIGLVVPASDPLFGGRRSHPGARSWLGVISGLVVFLGIYATSAFLPFDTGGWRDIVIALAALSYWAIWEGTWPGLVLGAFIAAAGTAAEIGLAEAGLIAYAPENANLFGVASWLPWLYLAASVGAGNLGRRLATAMSPPPPTQTGPTTPARFSTTTGRTTTTTGRFPSRT